MLEIYVPKGELFYEPTQRFIQVKDATLHLEHSLVSISKWESKWRIPFLRHKDFTDEQFEDYIKSMCITQNVDDNVFKCLTNENKKAILDYIADPHTATIITYYNKKNNLNKIITSEIIYYYMISYNIPFECQKWHLNRLITLIEIFNIKNGSNKSMSKIDTMKSNTMLNEARKKALKTKG